jgi:hypothetical protein
MEITRKLDILKELTGKENIEVVTVDGARVYGSVIGFRAQALGRPSVEMSQNDIDRLIIPLDSIVEIIDHNYKQDEQEEERKPGLLSAAQSFLARISQKPEPIVEFPPAP